MAVASETLDYIDRSGRPEISLNRIDIEEKTYIYGKDTERALMLETKRYEENENHQGYTILGHNYMYGNPQIGIEKNMKEAIKYYELAADQGNIQALESLGTAFSKGSMVQKDTKKAIEYLEKAISLGSSQGLHTLGYMYLNGNGVSKDMSKAIEYFKSSAEKGNPDSMNSLGVLYMNGQGVKKDYRLADKYFRQAAAMGHAPALFNLGVMYFEGLGLPRNCQVALELFQKVKERGELAKIILRAYSFYRSGDIEGAYLTYMLGAALGFENAQLSLGYMWEKDLVPLHCKYDKIYCAASYYTQAAQMHQSHWALYRLGDLSYYGSKHIPNNYYEAFEFYNKALNIPEAEFNRGYMLEFGIGTEKNTKEAQITYQSIIDKANNYQIEHEAAYPAQLALYALKFKDYIKDFPVMSELVETFSDIIIK